MTRNDITLRNRGFGPEGAMQLVEERAPHGFDRIENVASREELDSIAGSFAAAAGLDVETVNSRPPFVRPTQACLIAVGTGESGRPFVVGHMRHFDRAPVTSGRHV